MYDKRIITASALLILTGCSSLQTKTNEGGLTQVQSETIIADIVSAAAELNELNPLQTTIQVSEPSSELGSYVIESMRLKGYGLQYVDQAQGDNYLRYNFTDITSEKGTHIRYSINIGNVDIDRDYKIINGSVVPVSPLNVDVAVPAQAMQIDSDTYKSVDATNQYKSNAKSVIKKNLFLTGQSNYKDVLREYGEVSQHILVFGNDSLRLGKNNKTAISNITKAMNPKTDLLSITGCSHGRTGVGITNGVLAIGRANRVKEEFMTKGIDSDLLLDEGCWAQNQYHEFLPNRGVVVRLVRKAS